MEEIKNKPRAFITPRTFSEALYLAADQQEQIKRLKKAIRRKNTEIIELTSIIINKIQPEPSYIDTVLACEDTVHVSILAQDYGMSVKAFNILLCKLKLQGKVGQSWIPYQKYIAEGFVRPETFTGDHSDGTTGVHLAYKWTQKGRYFLYDFLKQHDVLPLIEQQNKQKAV